jgi:formyltetrahydrofolate synthetase
MEEKEDSRAGEKAGGGRGAKGGFSGLGGDLGAESCFSISACEANASLSVVLLVMKLDALRFNSPLSCVNSP